MLYEITDEEFEKIQQLFFKLTSIKLTVSKKSLVSGRLAKRLRHYDVSSFDGYFRIVMDSPAEMQIMLDLLTTNETSFFRENNHFDFLKTKVLPERNKMSPFRVWSAACSSGQEPYSIAMVLADVLGEARWEVMATDISTRVLETAQTGLYPLETAEKIPPRYLHKYCMKGVRSQEGQFVMSRSLRDRIKFRHVNLNGDVPELGLFDVIFLRNVMIYFDQEVKRKLVDKLLSRLKSGGYFFVGHSESLSNVSEKFRLVVPAVYQTR